MMKAWTMGLVLAATGTRAATAAACGGCFHEPAADSVVTGHRMAFATSATRTVLWDQIQYSGAPGEFGWVLPVKPGAYIEVSTDAWFEALDAVTTTSVYPPPLNCPSSSRSDEAGGCNCIGSHAEKGSAVDSISGSSYETPPSVTVVHQGTVGPYETVTLSSTDGSALRDWLSNHGYVVEADIEPIIDAYVSEGADFIALRLIPGQGVNQMTPVRVVTPGGDSLLPLRMVAAGIGSSVDIVLFVIGESRYALPDLTATLVKVGSLTYDFSSNESNYLSLREAALDAYNGFAYITPYAAARPFTRHYDSPSGIVQFGVSGLGSTATTLAELYGRQALANDGMNPIPQEACSVDNTSVLDSDLIVVDDASGGAVDVNAVASSQLNCGEYTDIAAALIGMHPSQAWLTRLEMNLPREALTMDCVVEPTMPDEVSSQVVAPKAKNAPCPLATTIAPATQTRSGGSAYRWASAGFLAVAFARRRRRK